MTSHFNACTSVIFSFMIWLQDTWLHVIQRFKNRLRNVWGIPRSDLKTLVGKCWWGFKGWFRKDGYIQAIGAVILLGPIVLGYYLVVWTIWLFRWLSDTLAKAYDKYFVQPPRKLLKSKEIQRRREVRRIRNAVKGLPLVRPRALTLSSRESAPVPEHNPHPILSTTETGKKRRIWTKRKQTLLVPALSPVNQSTADQVGTCSLYQLPYELRQKVWMFAVGGNHIHIVRRKGRLGNVYCAAQNPIEPKFRDLCCMSKDSQGFYIPTAWPGDAKPLGLLMTCRQIYSEAIDYLYSENRFSFDDVEVVPIFLKNLLPHREAQISAVHIAFNFSNPHVLRPRTFAKVAQPKNSNLTSWRICCAALDSLPNLKSLAATTLLLDTSDNLYATNFARNVLDILDSVTVNGTFTVTWPRAPINTRGHWWGVNNMLPIHPRFEIQPLSTQHLDLLGFLTPFNVQCLHCTDYTVIRKATRGYAEAILTREEAMSDNNQTVLGAFEYTRYWTFHTPCGGWIEFRYDWMEQVWSITQGAKQISDEETEKHVHKHPDKYPKLENSHERLQGLSVHEGNWTHPFAPSGTYIDVPTRDMFYRNVGWLLDR